MKSWALKKRKSQRRRILLLFSDYKEVYNLKFCSYQCYYKCHYNYHSFTAIKEVDIEVSFREIR